MIKKVSLLENLTTSLCPSKQAHINAILPSLLSSAFSLTLFRLEKWREIQIFSEVVNKQTDFF